MKTIQINRAALLAFALAAVAGSASVAGAGETTVAKGMVAKVITLPASNNSTLTVTIWTPTTMVACGCDTASPRQNTAKVIGLPAANGSSQSVTVWTGVTENKFEVAPLK